MRMISMKKYVIKIFNDNQHAVSKIIDRKISYSRF